MYCFRNASSDTASMACTSRMSICPAQRVFSISRGYHAVVNATANGQAIQQDSARAPLVLPLHSEELQYCNSVGRSRKRLFFQLQRPSRLRPCARFDSQLSMMAPGTGWSTAAPAAACSPCTDMSSLAPPPTMLAGGVRMVGGAGRRVSTAGWHVRPLVMAPFVP